MAELDLHVPAERISAFIEEAQHSLLSRRGKTALRKEKSTDWIHTAFATAAGKAIPIIVVLQVRAQPSKKGGRDVRVFLKMVRPPEGDELHVGGYTDLAPWPDGFHAAA